MTTTWGPRWTAQSDRPARLSDIPYADLPTELRLLLAWEGPLASALENLRRTAIVADVQAHQRIALNIELARWVDALPGDEAVARRTALRESSTGRLIVQAEVTLLPHRLPEDFLDVLGSEASGLGAALTRMQVLTRRELLWFGGTPLRGLRPGDHALAGDHGVCRCYRLITADGPVCVIEETFPDPLFT